MQIPWPVPFYRKKKLTTIAPTTAYSYDASTEAPKKSYRVRNGNYDEDVITPRRQKKTQQPSTKAAKAAPKATAKSTTKSMRNVDRRIFNDFEK